MLNRDTRKKSRTGRRLCFRPLCATYQRSDVAHWAHTFYGPAYRPPLVDIIVDGGPLSPICPSGDTCPPSFNGYAGDVEVDLDIETELSFSPDASHILVYNAPTDYTGQTELDEYAQIANDDLADVVSSSWAECENDAGAAYAQVENVIFEQFALQGQSVFSAAGDTGAFECIRSDGTTIVNALALYSSTDAPGWFGSGGTSQASPIWSAIFADRDSYQGSRSGNADQLLYLLYNLNYAGYFHDVTGIGQTTTNNGLFPTTREFDLATGIGTPKMSAIITGVP